MSMPRTLRTMVLLLGLAAANPLSAQAPAKAPPAATQDFQAAKELERAVELMQMNEEERGIKMLQGIPNRFPNSKVRFEALNLLGKHYVEKKQYALAIKQFTPILDSGNDVMRAEALYEIGKCNFYLAQYNQAFSFLRNVTTDYPNSVFANQAYYYIGMCHFAQKHWKKSIDALKMVGTAVSQEDEATRYTEAGERFFVKIHDLDLVVLAKQGDTLKVEITTGRGDKETVGLDVLDRNGEYYIGSIQTVPGVVTPGNGSIEIAGGDTLTTSYMDSNTAAGERNVGRSYSTRIVSTANIAFTDGAFSNIVKGLFLGQDAFVRLKDQDLDISDKADKVKVDLAVRYILKNEDPENIAAISLEEQKVETRDSLQVELTETGPHTGTFTAVFKVTELEPGMTPSIEDTTLHARQGDTIKLLYRDALHIDGQDEMERTYEAKVLGGSMQDVMAQVRVLSDLDLRARKNVIEARALKELAEIFRSVGLKTKSDEKALEGLSKVDEVVLNRKSISPEYVQDALQTKWEIFLVMEKLTEAIATCNLLIQLFPNSTLVDQAMVKIGQANLEKGMYQQAITIFSAILRLPKSDQAPYAAFMVGEAYEKMAESANNKAYLTNSMNAFQACAEKFPNSLFAGQAIEKVANFYLKMQDYQRAAELMQNVAQDFPDLDNMDAMLLKWAIALYRLNRMEEAYDKLTELMNEYPESPHAEKGKAYRVQIGKRLGKEEEAEATAGGGAAAPAAGTEN